MKKRTIIIFLALIILFSGYMNINAVSKKKKRLKPEIIKSKDNIYQILGLNIKNSFAAINSNGEFCIVTINETGRVKINNIVSGFPPVIGQEYYSDTEHNVLWMVIGRGFYALDIETKKTGHIIVSHGSESILNTFLVDIEKKIFLIEVVHHHPDNMYKFYILYDLVNEKIIFKSKHYDGVLFPFYDNHLLYCEFYGENYNLVRWHIIDHNFNYQKENKLLTKLSKMQMEVWDQSKALHLNKRMMIGKAGPIGNTINFSIRWDEEFKEIRIEPLTYQIPKNSRIDRKYIFSPDGNWVKTLIRYRTGIIRPYELAIYHVGEAYPQGLSMPILCGYTKENNTGAFMNHSEWGPCYVELDYEFNNKLFVYKLNDGLKILAEQAKNAVIK